MQYLTYFGGLLNFDGTIASDFCKNIGIAMKDVSSLHRLWSHAIFQIPRKIAYFKSLILARLMYGIDNMWLNQSERHRLDAFK